jgi:hypothetical protein
MNVVVDVLSNNLDVVDVRHFGAFEHIKGVHSVVFIGRFSLLLVQCFSAGLKIGLVVVFF